MADVLQDFNDFRDAASYGEGLFLGYQARWAADPKPVKVHEKSRRIGLSWAEAGDSVLYAAEAGTREKRDCWYIGYNKDMAQEFIGDSANWARAYNIAASAIGEYEEIDLEQVPSGAVVDEKKIVAFKIVLNSGRRITALSSRPSNLRGKQGRIIIDEAAFHDDLAGLLKAAMAMLIWGGQVHVISTHFGDSNPFNGIIQEIRAGKKPYGLHRTTLDDALADGLYRRICEVLGRTWSEDVEAEWRKELIDVYGDDADEELFCIPSQGTGVWIPRMSIEAAMSDAIPVVRYRQTDEFAQAPDYVRAADTARWCDANLRHLLAALTPDRRSYFGEDFARTGDLTVITPLQEQQDTTFRAPFSLELRNMPFREQEQILSYIVDHLPRFTFGALDARGNGEYMAERMMQLYGPGRIAQVMITEPWYREAMPKYKSAIQEKSIIMPKDTNVLEDHQFIKVIKGIAKIPEGHTKGSDKRQRHGDSAIAGAMAWFATYQDASGPIEYTTVATRPTFGSSDENDDRPGNRPDERSSSGRSGLAGTRGSW